MPESIRWPLDSYPPTPFRLAPLLKLSFASHHDLVRQQLSCLPSIFLPGFRARARPSAMAPSSVERWNMSLHDLGWPCVLEPLHKFNRMARKCFEPCAGLVRYLCVSISSFEFSVADFTRHKASRLIVGMAVAIPAASLCINRRLFKIATAQTLMVSRTQVSQLCCSPLVSF